MFGPRTDNFLPRFAICGQDIGACCCKEIQDTLGDWKRCYDPTDVGVSSARPGLCLSRKVECARVPGMRRSSAACILNDQDLIVIGCRARFNGERFMHRNIAAKEISATCWMEASILSVHIDRHVCAMVISGFISWNPKPTCKHANVASAVNEAECLGISKKRLHLAKSKRDCIHEGEGTRMDLMLP